MRFAGGGMSKTRERKLRRHELILKVESQRYELGRLRNVWLESMKPADKAWGIASGLVLPLALCTGLMMLRRVKKQSKNPLQLSHYIRRAIGIWTTVRFVHKSLAPKN
ncbi:hypothetical protein EYB39_23080 [Pantoea agglomerans]|nr:hypothetical protein EYB39_23080 [Pantoea agglomerans]